MESAIDLPKLSADLICSAERSEGVGEGLGWVEGARGSDWAICSICVGEGLGVGEGMGMGVGEGLGVGDGMGVGVGKVLGVGEGLGTRLGVGVRLGVGEGLGTGLGKGLGKGSGWAEGLVCLTLDLRSRFVWPSGLVGGMDGVQVVGVAIVSLVEVMGTMGVGLGVEFVGLGRGL